MAAEPVHPAVLAQAACETMSSIKKALVPSMTQLNPECRVAQFATSLIDNVLVPRIAAIDTLLDGETYGFSEPLQRLRELYIVQLKLLQTVKDFSS